MDVDFSQLFGWCVVVVVVLALPLLLGDPEETRRRLGPRLVGWAERAATRFRPVDEVDPLAEALRAQLRREKLLADVQRLRRLVATDTGMSAVRQLGNRIAYASLVAELEAARDLPTSYAFTPVGMPVAASIPAARWSDETMISAPVARYRGDGGQRPPAVEVLELGPRRRAAH